MPRDLRAARLVVRKQGLYALPAFEALRRLRDLGHQVSYRTLTRWRAEDGAPSPPSPQRGKSIVPEEALLGPESCAELARRYGVSRQLISRMRARARIREGETR